ncbi:MAG: cupin domain-containing protein [Burkholderiaceae bacterium]|nr:cupin domain-containing protein [Burkholderiaceae bacterium]
MPTVQAERADANAQYSAHAMYIQPSGPFDVLLPEIVPHVFRDEQKKAFAPDAPTGMVLLDLSASLRTDGPATTPVMLARYLVIRAQETLSHRFVSSGEIFYPIRGRGASTSGGVTLSWKAGDVFCFPGGAETRHTADEDTVLLCVTNEPELAYQGLPAPPLSDSVTQPTLFKGELIDQHLSGRVGVPTQTAGKGILLVTPRLDRTKAMTPTLSIAMNTLEPGGDQRPHLHNAAALTLAIRHEGVHSTIDGQRYDWHPFCVMVTPPRAVHSHHNRGPGLMKALVFQDGGLYYQYRNPAFAFGGDSPR